uniref:Uncharacterized protein n=1 Tax=Bicosoecida sp. CB-2014 TaxID=1486930 RepID=A0A7S1CKG8_9STRA
MAASGADVERAKAFLQKKSGPVSVYDHLTELILKLITDKPDDAVGVFEHLSGLVKQNTFSAAAPAEGGESKVDAADAAATAEWAAAAGKIFSAPEPAEGVDEPGAVQDLTDEANYLEWAGVNIGRTEAFRLHLALKALAASTPVQNVRFWGKVLGTGGDYYVAEGTLEEEGEEGAADADGTVHEAPGEGANRFAYWACSFAGGAWTRLPNVTPAQVRAAGAIRRFFSGDLDASVGGHPPFPGKEKEFLRATIARITAATVISPAGVFAASEDEDKPYDIVPNEEEFEIPALNEAGSWVHHLLPLNKLGRTTPNPPKVDEEGEPIEDPDAPEPPAVLGTIEEEEGQWSIRGLPASGMAEGAEPGLVAVRNLAWPGAVTVGFGKRFANVYVGYGAPYSAAVFAPSVPGDVAAEYNINDEEKPFTTQVEVTVDPDAGAPAGEEGEGEEDE